MAPAKKAVTKKSTAKKPVAKKEPAKKPTAVKKTTKKTAAKRPITKKPSKADVLDQRAAQWAGIRAVVLDVETTGLNVERSRVISLAMTEIQGGRLLASFASLVDPGLNFIEASHIHHLTAEQIKASAAPSFSSIADMVLSRMIEHNDETVLLAGHNITFDALMVHNELRRIDRGLPTIGMLDTRTLANRAGVAATSLAELAEGLGIVAVDEHTAVSDSHVSATALLLLVDRLSEADPSFSIHDVVTVFEPSLRTSKTGTLYTSGRDLPELSPRHQAEHEKVLTTKSAREKSLDVCLSENCVAIVERVEDVCISARAAHEVAGWCWMQLDRDDITRETQGRLLTSIAVAIGKTEDAEAIREYFDSITEALDTYGPCTKKAACDRCSDPDSNRTCRFETVRYQLLAVFLTVDDQLDEDRADEFIKYRDPSVRYGRGRPPLGWFDHLVAAGDLDAAGYGAQLAAQAGAQSRRSGRELALLQRAWDAGSRNAMLADQLSKRLIATAPADGSRSHLDAALAVCVEGLAGKGASRGKVWQRLEQRRDRIMVRQSTLPRPAPQSVRNRRMRVPNRYALPPVEDKPVAPPPTKKRTTKKAAKKKVSKTTATKANRAGAAK